VDKKASRMTEIKTWCLVFSSEGRTVQTVSPSVGLEKISLAYQMMGN
jgi:hypothetical protein